MLVGQIVAFQANPRQKRTQLFHEIKGICRRVDYDQALSNLEKYRRRVLEKAETLLAALVATAKVQHQYPRRHHFRDSILETIFLKQYYPRPSLSVIEIVYH